MKRKKTKTSYRLRNWREYNRALVQRGSLTMQKIERKHVPWRARLKRLPHKTLSFSHSCLKHDD